MMIRAFGAVLIEVVIASVALSTSFSCEASLASISSHTSIFNRTIKTLVLDITPHGVSRANPTCSPAFVRELVYTSTHCATSRGCFSIGTSTTSQTRGFICGVSVYILLPSSTLHTS